MVVIRDIDFLDAKRVLTGCALYKYESGALRGQVLRHLGISAATHCNIREFRAEWHNGTFFPTVRAYDLGALTAGAQKSLVDMLAAGREEPTLVMIQAPRSLKLAPGLEYVIDEVAVTSRMLSSILDWLASRSDLSSAVAIRSSAAFKRHFRDWLAERGLGRYAFSDLITEFDKQVLFHSALAAGEQIADLAAQREIGPRADSILALRAYLAGPNHERRARLLRAMAIKRERGLPDSTLILHYARAALSVAALPLPRMSAGTAYQGATPGLSHETLLLWLVTTAVFIQRLRSDRSTSAVTRGVIAEIDAHARDFEVRLGSLHEDPLATIWSVIAALICSVHAGADVNGRSQPIESRIGIVDSRNVGSDLVEMIRRILPSCGHGAWTERLRRLVLLPAVHFEFVNRIEELQRPTPQRFEDFLGQDAAIRQIQRRLASEDNTRPIFIVGDPDSDAENLARHYAKAIGCDVRLLGEAEPCHCCEACRAFDAGASLDLSTLDLNHVDVTEHISVVRKSLGRALVAKHRVIIVRLSGQGNSNADALLSSLEKRYLDTTIIGLAFDRTAVRPAILSRGIDLELQPLNTALTKQLIKRWFPDAAVSLEIAEVVTILGRGQPGQIWQLCQRLPMTSILTLQSVKSALDVDWAESVLVFWKAIRTGRIVRSSELSGTSDVEMIRRLRALVAALISPEQVFEAAFVGMEAALRLQCDELKTISEINNDDLMRELYTIWVDDGLIDQVDLDAAISRTQLLFSRSALLRAV